MIATWMLYAVAIGAALALAGAAAERAADLLGLPRRWVWVAGIGATLLVPVAIPAWRELAGPAPAAAVPDDAGLVVATAPRATLAAAPEQALTRDWGALLSGSLALGWAALSLSGAALLVGSSLSLRRLRRRWRPARLAGERVLVSERTGPALVGAFRSSIVVPSWILEWDAERQRLIVSHEASHARARDPLLLLGAWLALVIAPWNPALWWQVRRLRLAVEVDCDRRVVRSLPETRVYAMLLLEVGRQARQGWLPATAFSEPRSFLERRIRTMTARRPRGWRWHALALSLVVLGLPAVVWAAPAARHPAIDGLASWLRSGLVGIPPQEPATLWITSDAKYHLDAPTAPVVPESALADRLREVREASGGDRLQLRAQPGDRGMGYAMIVARQAACAAGYRQMLVDAEMPPTGADAAGARVRSEETFGDDCTVVATAILSDAPASMTGSAQQPPQDFAYEVGVLERQPSLSNQGTMASVMERLYPRLLQDAGIAGTVMMQFVIEPDGTVDMSSVKVLDSPHAQLSAASIAAVERFRFRPGRYRGENVRVILRMPITWVPAERNLAEDTVVRAAPGSMIGWDASRSAYSYEVLERRPVLSNQGVINALMQRLRDAAPASAPLRGAVDLQFVIEPDGTPDMSTVHVLNSASEAVTAASVQVAERLRYRPGRYQGENVRVIWQTPLIWTAPVAQAGQAEVAAGITVAGWVIDERTSRPITGSSVVIPALTRGTVTREDGRFMLGHLPAGTHRLVVTVPGRAGNVAAAVRMDPIMTVPEGTTLTIEIVGPSD